MTADDIPAVPSAEAAVTEQRKTLIEQPPTGNTAQPVDADGDGVETDAEKEVGDIEELIVELHRGKTLLADGRLELCQLSKLLQCIRARDVRMIDNLVSKGVPRLLDYAHPTDNETVLGLTASRNDDTILTHLLELGADPNAADAAGRTAAMRACEYGHLQSMNVLAHAGLDMTLVDDNGQGQSDQIGTF